MTHFAINRKLLLLTTVVCGALLFPAFIQQPKFIKEDPITLVGLGEKLFFEKMLSRDQSVSCASCHIPEFAFADTVAFSVGVGGKLGKRNTPSVMNMASRGLMFYDGRAASLEDQVHFPVEDLNEMAFNLQEGAKRLNVNKQYQAWFKSVFQEEAKPSNIAKAIAAYEETLETSNTLFDNYMKDLKPSMSAAAIRGREVFMSKKAKCFDCHFSPDFTGDEFRNIGLFDQHQFVDRGRFDVTKDSADLGKFKVPGLRNVAITPPYMHNGMFNTLEEVIEYYDNPFKFVANPINADSLMQKPLGLTKEEKSDLVAFLHALTDLRFVKNQ
ncbi:MAG: cytochrome-c peroxidase [Saprospiraceae bacterium]|jgi:cytochrome c peroxidase|nr:cytochrome-c peroxidase [Saprospiraceae bacterium]